MNITPDTIYISHDPFARTELRRALIETKSSCEWCGQKRKSGKLFLYLTETANGRQFEHDGLFCSKSCHDCYHMI